MNFPHSYYDDEVKCNFYIPSMIKRTWAAGLAILADIDTVCRRNNIQYFAEWGTLLGTVRHGGYIPWDDDLDICMKRADYEKFLSIAKDELPTGYDIVNYRTSPSYRQMLSRVVNTDHYRFDPEFMTKFSGLPFAMGIDIFPLDYISNDDEYEQKRHELVYFIQHTVDQIEKNGLPASALSQELSLIEAKSHSKINAKENVPQQLRFILDKIYGELPEERASYIALYALWFSDHSRKFPKNYYETSFLLPFENTTIPVPLFYNDILKQKYSPSYMNPIRSGGAHDYPYFQNHINILREHFDFTWPEYAFNPDDLLHTNVRREADFNTQFSNSMSLLADMHQQISRTFSCNEDITLSMLYKCQNEAIRIGTLIEMRYFVGSDTVHILEEYCELLYELSQIISCTVNISSEENDISSLKLDLSDNTSTVIEIIQQLDNYITKAIDKFENELSQIQFILFISFYYKYFSSFEKLMKIYSKKDNIIFKIMPISHIEISSDMTSVVEKYDIDAYPDSYEYIDFNNFSFDTHPDEIIINFPYDEYNPLFTTKNIFYSRNLISHTNKLVYIPPFNISTIKASDARSIKNLQYCACTSAVVVCDEIIVFDDNIRNRYIEVLTNFSGDKYVNIWQEKIKSVDDTNTFNNTSSNCINSNKDAYTVSYNESYSKSLIYYIGLSTFIGNETFAISKVSFNINTILNYGDKIDLLIIEQDNLRSELSRYNTILYKEYMNFINSIDNLSIITENDKRLSPEFYAQKYDAYYGEASYYATAFINQSKPVMIQNLNI